MPIGQNTGAGSDPQFLGHPNTMVLSVVLSRPDCSSRHQKGQQNFMGQNEFQVVEIEKLGSRGPGAAVE